MKSGVNIKSAVAPVAANQRYIILDALRGFALLGIAMANYPEFSLYSFLSDSAAMELSTAGADKTVSFLLAWIVDGKFYTIFSLLFGIGFSIILANVERRGGNGFLFFYRRMAVLFIIGLCHLLFIWSGDILMLYALVGMLLPLFTRCNDKVLMTWACAFLFLPVVVDAACEISGMSLSKNVVEYQWILCDKFGITEDNFAYWLRDAKDYGDMFKFLMMGAVERMTEFIDGNRYFKVLGLFLIGYMIGRNRYYARLDEFKQIMKLITSLAVWIGLPLSAFYAWSCVSHHQWGLTVHSALYFTSVYLLSFGYVAVLARLYLRFKDASCWVLLAYPGRMALTNYIGQSAIGVFLFYGIGLGLGATTGLVWVECIVIVVFVMEIAWSAGWLTMFRFGPLEWLWRCFTYGRIFSLRKDK